MKKIISNEIVTLRSLEPTDLDVLFKWENDCWLWTVSNIMTPSPKSYLWQYLQNYDSDIFNTRQLRLMITLTENGEPVGTVDITNLDPFNNRAEIGIMVDKAFQGKGIGDEAMKLIIGYVRDYLGPALCTSASEQHHLLSAAQEAWFCHCRPAQEMDKPRHRSSRRGNDATNLLK